MDLIGLVEPSMDTWSCSSACRWTSSRSPFRRVHLKSKPSKIITIQASVHLPQYKKLVKVPILITIL